MKFGGRKMELIFDELIRNVKSRREMYRVLDVK